MVAESERHDAAVVKAHWLSDAIAQYRGIPGVRDRRKELKHLLVDVQSGIPDEMSSFSYPIDLTDLIEGIKSDLAKQSNLLDTLLFFACITASPQPKRLAAEARTSINETPLSSIFPAVFHDREGKIIHRTGGTAAGEESDEGVIKTNIAQNESLRRHIASCAIQCARQYIVDRRHVGDDTLQALLSHSPFVPGHLLCTYSRGFRRFFDGDFVSALYILTPLLESSSRHILKLAGHDVT